MDQEIEAMIKAQPTDAPRVTPEHLASLIACEYYLNGATATMGCPQHPSLALLTICILVTRTGFTLIGHSACVSPERYDAQIGQKVARQKAMDQLWALEGYLLMHQQHAAA